MTAYFDQKHEELAAVEKLGQEAGWKQLGEIDARLVWDVTLAAEQPGFPEDLRRRLYELVLKFSVECQPVNAKTTPQYEEWYDHCRALNRFVWELHTVFHEVAQRTLPGFSDDPRAPLRALYNRGEELREELASEAP